MTDIRIVFNPAAKESEVYCGGRRIEAKENKIYTFLEANDFYECLLPFTKRYMIWQGLLPELIIEANDDALRIVFEGTEADYRRVEEAFRQTRTVVSNLGYENSWQLSHEGNFEERNLNALLADLAGALREMCETRAELRALDAFCKKLDAGSGFAECEREFKKLAGEHLKKWEKSDNRYKEEKIGYIRNAVLERLEQKKREFGITG